MSMSATAAQPEPEDTRTERELLESAILKFERIGSKKVRAPEKTKSGGNQQ